MYLWFRHIISGLEEEIRQWGSKCAMLEQENKLLEVGTEQLQVVRSASTLFPQPSLFITFVMGVGNA